MIALFLTRHWKLIGSALVVALLLGVIAFRGQEIDRLQRAYAALTAEAANVLLAVRDASDNPKLTWDTAPGQIVALGESNRRLKSAIADQNATIDEWAREASARKAEADEWKRIADRAEAQRQSALRRLGNMAATPGTRDDCMQLLREANDALDLARSAGV